MTRLVVVAVVAFCVGWLTCLIEALVGSKLRPPHRTLVDRFGPVDMFDVWPTDMEEQPMSEDTRLRLGARVVVTPRPVEGVVREIGKHGVTVEDGDGQERVFLFDLVDLEVEAQPDDEQHCAGCTCIHTDCGYAAGSPACEEVCGEPLASRLARAGSSGFVRVPPSRQPRVFPSDGPEPPVGVTTVALLCPGECHIVHDWPFVGRDENGNWWWMFTPGEGTAIPARWPLGLSLAHALVEVIR